MPDYVIAEVDIAADGSITVEPNPILVASGQTLMFHVNNNASEATMLSVDWPKGPDSPFGVTGHSEAFARRCLGIGAPVEWPEGVERAIVTLSAHGSPVLGTLAVTVHRAAAPDWVAPPGFHTHSQPIRDGFPNITHHYYFGSRELHVAESDWEAGHRSVVIANTENCYRYKVTNKGPSRAIVKASPSNKETVIDAGRSAYVECSRLEVRTKVGHAHGDIDPA